VDGSSTRHVSATDMGATKAPMIPRSYLCKQLRQLVSTSQNQCFRCTALMLPAKWLIRRKLKRRYVLAFFQKLPPCLVGIEACASSHYWARAAGARSHGQIGITQAVTRTLRFRTTEKFTLGFRE
jgi:hypothetical protein